MKKKILSALVIFGLAFGTLDSPVLYAQEAETESVVIEYETEQVDGENYGYIPASYTIPVYESEAEVLDEYAPGLNGAVNIPAYYNAVEEGHVSSVKNQGGYGTCWAFAAISSAESDAIIDGRFVATDVETEPDYSEAQLAWFTYNRLADPLGGTTGDKVEVIASGQNYLTIGGNSYYSTMALASWISPAEESVMPYEPYDTNYPAGTVVDSSYGYESCVAHLQDAYWISMSDPDSIKQMIMNYGSLDSSICYSNEFMKEVSVNGELTSLFYNPVDDVQNHEISLVGWDDTIDAGLFTKTVGGVEYTPSGDGAWLVKNSYGTTMHNDGYFWISYYDTSLMYYDNSYNMATVYNFESTDNYDYNYQYDGSYALVEVSGSEYTESIYTANVFTAQNSAQQLEAVGFYTTVPNMEYSIQVYKITEEGTPLGEPLMTAPVEGIEPYAGYHTVELSERVILDKGERFSVVVKSTLTTSGYVGKGASAFLDMSTSDGNLRYTSSGAAGQSYLSYDGSKWDDMYARYGANLRVKAFTNYRPVESVDIPEDNYSVVIDGDMTLTANITPSNATILDVTWSSDDENVVTVDASGKVTPVGIGTATVTVTTKDGAKTDNCIVKVKARHTTPAAPTLRSKTETTITLNEVENCLYSMDKINWQSSNVFTGLNSGTSYTFYIMKVEDENYSDSFPSEALAVKTYSSASGVTVAPSTVRLEIGGTENTILTANVTPSDTMDKTVAWSSDNQSVATVDANGLVTAVGPGQASITATTNSGNKKATCTVNVYKHYDKPAVPQLESKTVDTVTLVKLDGYKYSIDGINWSSSNIFSDLEEDTAYTFYVKRQAKGYYLESEASDGLLVTTYKSIEGITLNTTSIKLGLNDVYGYANSQQLVATINPSNVEDASVVWSSSNEKVAKVDSNGLVTAVSPGKATITVKSAICDVYKTCEVKVYDKYVKPSAPKLISKTATTVTLKKIDGYLYSKDGIAWQESNIFTGLEPKTTYSFRVKTKASTYYCESDSSDVIKITTYSKVSVVAVTPNTASLEMGVKETVKLTATVSPSDVEDGTVRWSSSDETVAKVSNNGTVTALKAGTVVITATTNEGNYKDSCTVQIAEKKFVAPDINVNYRTHIQSYGWEGDPEDIDTWCVNGEMSGTEGESKRLEGINIVVNPATACEDLDLGIQYTTHCQNYGWLPWSADGDMNGTEGESKRLEAIMIKLTGDHAKYYDVYYRVHAQSYGWLGWAKNGEAAGTAGYSKRLEGIQIVVVKKDEDFNHNVGGIKSGQEKPFEAKEGSSPIVNYPATSNTNPIVPGTEDVNVAYRTHVQTYGWQGWKYNGQMSGTEGESKRLEGIEIKLTNKDYDGGIAYTTHVQTYGWQGNEENPATWMTDGEMSGTSGESKRLEAIRIKLTGDLADNYDIYYRVHAQSYGWLGWASNGEAAGTAGYSKRLEGIQIVIVPRGDKAPSSTYMNVEQDDPRAYISR